MEALRRVLKQIVDQGSKLNVAQRVAMLFGAVLIAFSVAWMVSWAATSDMKPLLEQDFSPEEIDQVQLGLEARGVEFRVVGNRVFIPSAANRAALITGLELEGRLPDDTSIGFQKLIEESNPWMSQAELKRRTTVYQQAALERVLTTFEGVQEARVFLNLNDDKRLVVRHEMPASASVQLKMRGGAPVGRPLAIAAAKLVAGAVRNLKLEHVEVVDSMGRTALDWSEMQSDSPSRIHDQRRRLENEYAGKILDILRDPFANVSVRAETELTQRQTNMAEPLSPVETKTITESTLETTGTASQQPGVAVNTGTSNGGLGQTLRQRETSTNEAHMTVGQRSEQTSTPSGDLKSIHVAISLSDVYLRRILSFMQPDLTEVTFEDIESVFDQERAKILRLVQPLLKGATATNQDQFISLAWHIEPSETVPLGPTGVTGTAMAFGYSYAPQIGLAVLALVALWMMMRMARKGIDGEAFGMEIGLPEDALEASRRAAEDVGDGVDAISSQGEGGEVVTATEGILEATEIDEATVQLNKMVEQVANFIAEDPETVAGVIERWIHQDKYQHR